MQDKIHNSLQSKVYESDNIIPLIKMLIMEKLPGSISHRFVCNGEKVRVIYIGFSLDYNLLHDCKVLEKMMKCFEYKIVFENKDNVRNKLIIVYDKKYEKVVNMILEYAKNPSVNLLSLIFKKVGIVHYLHNDKCIVIGIRSENISDEHIEKMSKIFPSVKRNCIKFIVVDEQYNEIVEKIAESL